MKTVLCFNFWLVLLTVILIKQSSCNFLLQIRMKCPQAISDLAYIKCEADVRRTWYYEKNPEKAFCCSRLDSYECLFSSIERNCAPDMIEYYRAALRNDNFNLKYNGFCTNYNERSECHLAVWAIVTIPVISAIIIILLAILIYYKCFK